MSYILTLLVSSLVVIGCGHPDRDVTGFEENVAVFESYYGHHIDTSIAFDSSLPHEVGARCYSGENRIGVNEYAWNHSPQGMHEEMILHELGHCVLNRDHTTEDSIMRASGIPGSAFLSKHDFYLEELFK